MDVPQLLQAVEQHIELGARVARALQAGDRRFDKLLGEAHGAIVLGPDTRPGAEDHGGDERQQANGRQRYNEEGEPEAYGHGANLSMDCVGGDAG